MPRPVLSAVEGPVPSDVEGSEDPLGESKSGLIALQSRQ